MIPANQTTMCVRIHNWKENVRAAFTWKSAFDSEADRQYRHKGFISHGVDHGPHHGLQFPSSCYVTVDEIGDACVCE